MSTERVLVTGASGFIAKHCIAELLRNGYAVRGTVRSKSRAPEIERAIERAGVDNPSLELAEADLTRDDGWGEAVRDCRYVLHVASPFPAAEPRDREALLGPARDGATRVVDAAARAGAQRVVVTSSIAAVMYCAKPDHEVLTEEDWSNTRSVDISTYAASKTLAERAAWERIGDLREAGFETELSVVNPGFVLGPALDKDLSTSHHVMRMLGRGTYPAVPRIAYPIVDVRDVAAAHVAAMKEPSAAGERFICATDTLSLHEIGMHMIEAVPDLKRKVPRFKAHSWFLRGAARFDRNLRAIRGDLDRRPQVSSSRARDVLGVMFRTPKEAIFSAVQSLRQLGIV